MQRQQQTAIMDITALILAGGEGSRMNSEDKAWVTFRGKPLIAHVIDRIQSSVDEIVISYNRSEELFAELPYRRYRDNNPRYLGPLSGIVSCAPYITTELTFIVPCDVPLLPMNTVEVMSQYLEGHDIVIANDGERLQPLILLARTSVLMSTITSYMDAGNLSVTEWCSSLDHGVARFEKGSGAFLNVNEVSQL